MPELALSPEFDRQGRRPRAQTQRLKFRLADPIRSSFDHDTVTETDRPRLASSPQLEN